MKIGKDTIATLVYTLRYDDAQGDIIEQVDEKAPMETLMGHDVMLEVLEKNLQGLQEGDSFEFIIGEGQGYGEYDEEKVVTVPQTELMAAVPEDEEVEIQEGDIIPIEDMDGAEYQAVVLKKKDGKVTLDFNHPLAGETLHFMGKVLGVRKATKEEIEAELQLENPAKRK
ncbi:MAG: FKBP-type peptidyl-prolyl cis-trans isomerase [Bacteroides sp.]|nr:FKBP-type peptidyl-prolyl cis-trans isomerase [Bacteroides sp.]MCM1084711.1 FKBP-type peptidyl-prolyl cis-trans isomerase [Bacteroides sp.]